MVEKLGQIECCIFTLTMLPSKVLRKKVRFTIGARASNSAAGQKFMLKGLSLSLSCTANCSQPCTKEWPPLFLTDFSNSFLIDVIHAPRIYPIPDVSLRSDQRLTPLLQLEQLYPLYERKKIMDELKFLFSPLRIKILILIKILN